MKQLTTLIDVHRILATEVLGWRLVRGMNLPGPEQTDEVWVYIHPHDGVLRGQPYRVTTRTGTTFQDHSWERWQPQTNPADAKEVLRAMARHGFLCEITYRDTGDGPPDAWVTFTPRKVSFPEVYYRGMADDIEPAICLAALHWRGYQVDPALLRAPRAD